jgi:hypothetical protein
MKVEFSRQIFDESSDMKFQNSSSTSRVAPCRLTDRQTDKHDKANICFSQFCECAYNVRTLKKIIVIQVTGFFGGVQSSKYDSGNCSVFVTDEMFGKMFRVRRYDSSWREAVWHKYSGMNCKHVCL